jgi:hypothetical protein
MAMSGRFETIGHGNVDVRVGSRGRGCYSVADRLEMAMSGRFETIGRGNVDVWVWGRGGTLQRSRTPINGDEWQI